MKKTITLTLFIASLLTASFVFAGIRVNTLQLNFFPGQAKYQDILITNQGDKTAYVQTKVFKRPDLKTDPQKVVPLKGDPKSFGLLVTPAKLALKPHQIRRVRVISLVKNNPGDVAYTISIMPVKSPLKALDVESDVSRGGLQVTTGFEIGVYVRPANAKPKLTYKRVGKLLELQNNGNTNTLVADFEQCPVDKKDKEACIKYKDVKRLFADTRYDIKLEKAEPVTFKSYYLEGIKIHTSN